MQRRIFRFLANRQAEVSARLARAVPAAGPCCDVQRWTEPEAIYALGSGVGAATVVAPRRRRSSSPRRSSCSPSWASRCSSSIPGVTIVAIAMFAVVVLVMQRILTKRSTRNAQVMTEASIDTLAAVSEALQTYREATVLNRRDLYLARYERLIGRYARRHGQHRRSSWRSPSTCSSRRSTWASSLLAVVQFVTKDFAAAASTIALFLAAGSRVMPALLRLQGAGITIRNASVPGAADVLHGRLPRHPRASTEANAGPTPASADRGGDQGAHRGRATATSTRRSSSSARIRHLPRRRRAGPHRRHASPRAAGSSSPWSAAPAPASRPSPTWSSACSSRSRAP